MKDIRQIRPKTPARLLLGFCVGLLVVLFAAPIAEAQLYTLTRDQLIKYTAQNPYERFPDGRPKVPNSILERVQGLSAEEVLGIARHGFANQYADGFQILRPGKKLVGRAFTLQLMPARPDVQSVILADRKAAGLGNLSHQTAIDMLQEGDVFVVDVAGNVDAGGIIGDNLAYYIWKTTNAGFVIDGAIRDLEGLANFDMAGYFRAAVPPAIRQVMVTGINIPVQIGKVTVMPGDVVMGDREGVYFIPPHLVQEVVENAHITHLHDEWTKQKFDTRKYKSTEIYGSPSAPDLIKEYDDFLKSKLSPAEYEAYQKRRRNPPPAAKPKQ